MKFSKTLAVAREQIHREVNRLHTVNPKPEVEVRLQETNDLIEEYVTQTGERPVPRILNRLGDYLLVDVLADKYKHHRKDAYPIQSNSQAKSKNQRHIAASYDDELGGRAT